MQWWSKLRTLWPGALRQQVTRTGVVYGLSLVLISVAAVISGNNLLYLIVAAMFSILLISGFVSKLVLAGLEVDLLLPAHVSARRKVRATIRLKNLKRWMPSFSLSLTGTAESGFASPQYYPAIPGGATLDEPADLYFPKRGSYAERTFHITTRFPFGFAERRERVTLRHEIIVYPCLDPRPEFETLLAAVSGELESQQRGRGADFYRIRPYENTESARHLDWKSTAHTGALQVREFARDEDHQVLIYLDLAAAQDQAAWFEHAVECAAFLAYRLAGNGRRLRLRTQQFDLAVPAEGDVYSILKYLALAAPDPKAQAQPPDDDAVFQILLTPRPASLANLGWPTSAPGLRLLGPDAFPLN